MFPEFLPEGNHFCAICVTALGTSFFLFLTLTGIFFFCYTNRITRFPHRMNFDPDCTQIHKALKTLCKAFCFSAYMPFKSEGFLSRHSDSKHWDVSRPSPTQTHTRTQSSTHAQKSQPQCSEERYSRGLCCLNWWDAHVIVYVQWTFTHCMWLLIFPTPCQHVRRLKIILIIMVYNFFQMVEHFQMRSIMK